jgi:hypothetical protein
MGTSFYSLIRLAQFENKSMAGKANTDENFLSPSPLKGRLKKRRRKAKQTNRPYKPELFATRMKSPTELRGCSESEIPSNDTRRHLFRRQIPKRAAASLMGQ